MPSNHLEEGRLLERASNSADYPNSRKFFIKAVLSPNLDFVDNLLDIGYLRCHFLRFLPLPGSFDCSLDREHAIFSAEPDVLLVQGGRNQCCLVVFLNARVQIGRNVLGFRRSIDRLYTDFVGNDPARRGGLGDIPSFCSGVVRMNFSAKCNCILIAIFSNGYISQVCLFQPFAHSTLIRSVVAGIRFCSQDVAPTFSTSTLYRIPPGFSVTMDRASF